MKKTNKLFAITAIIAVIGFAAISMTGCKSPGDDTNHITIDSIEVTTPPSKIHYSLGEELELDGMVVKATYSDGTTEVIDNSKLGINGFDSETAGEKTVTVSFQEKTDEFTVTVYQEDMLPDIDSIKVITLPTKTHYNLGEDFDPAGMVVTVTYLDGTTAVITNYATDTSGYDKTIVGHHTITVTYGGKTDEFSVNVIDPSLPTVETPVASIETGIYTAVQSVTLTTATSGAKIYYTTDGTEPTENSTLYSGAISINVSTHLKAFAVKEGYNDSDELTAEYTLQVLAPTADTVAGVVNKGTEVALNTATEGAEIWYTTDDSAPAKNGAGSAKYTAKIAINTSTTIKAIAVKDGWENSDIMNLSYFIPKAAAPAASPEAGNYDTVQSVTLNTTTEGAAIRYTTDGTDPAASSPLYSSAISIGATTTLKAIAIKEGWDDSEILTAVYNIVLPFTSAPVLTLEPDSGKITYTWTDSDPAADSYDVYWKEGIDLTAAQVKTGTKIPNASSGGEITGLTNDTPYSFIVTANKASYTSIDSEVETAIPSPPYIITGSSASFTATQSSTTIGTGAIQTVIDAIKSHANGKAVIIHFGDGETALDISTTPASFNNTSGTWGKVELSGKITGSSTTSTTGTIAIAGDVSVTSTADIANSATTNGRAIYYNSTGTLTISGGVVSANTAGYAIYNNSTGTLNITGGTVSATTGRAVHNASTGAITVSSGTVSGYDAVSNASTGAVTVSGGIVQSTQTYGNAISNSAGGTVTISGGTVQVSGSSYCYAVSNSGAGQVIISGGTVSAGTSSNNRAVSNSSSGTVTITSGEVKATAGYAVYISATGTINITGGTVSATTGCAVYNSNPGTVNITGGTVSATTGYAVYNYSTGKITVSQASGSTTKVTSANTNASQGTIYIASGGTTVVRLEITGGTVENTSTGTNGNAVYNTSAGAVTMSGGTVSTTATSGRAILNNSTGAVTISGGAVTAPVNSTAYSIYNSSTGVVTVNPAAVITGNRYP